MDATRKHFTAYYLGKSLVLAKIEKRLGGTAVSKKRNSLLFLDEKGRTIAVFSFGVAVIYGHSKSKHRRILEKICGTEIELADEPKTEVYEAIIDPGKKVSVEFNCVYFNDDSLEKILIVSEVMAQSVAIDFVEERVESSLKKFEGIHLSLEKTGAVPMSDIEARKTIGAGRGIIQYVVSSLSFLDKPDITWEKKELESLYDSMRRMFELDDRFSALKFRLEFIQDTSELVLDILQNRKAVNLEIAIVVLFVIDIVLVLFEFFAK